MEWDIRKMDVRMWSAHVRLASRSKKGEQYYPRAFTAHLRKLHPHHMHNIAYCKRVRGPESDRSLCQAGQRCNPHCCYSVDSLLLLHQILQTPWEGRGGREGREGGRVRRGKEEGKPKGDWDAEVMSVVNDEDISIVCVDTIYLSSILRHTEETSDEHDILWATLLNNQQLLHFNFPN